MHKNALFLLKNCKNRLAVPPPTSGVTEGRQGGMPPGSSDVGPFLEMGPLNLVSFAT